MEEYDETTKSIINDMIENIKYIANVNRKSNNIEQVVSINKKYIITSVKNKKNMEMELLKSRYKLIISITEEENRKLREEQEKLREIIKENEFKVEFFDGFQEQWLK
jgi:hypothetical protein